MLSQKKLEKLNAKELQEQFDKNITIIENLKIIIRDFDTNLLKLGKLSEEARNLGDKFKRFHADLLKKDYQEEDKFFGKNKGTLDLYFETQSKEDLYCSTYEQAMNKVTEILELEEKFVFFGSRFLEEKRTVWGENLHEAFMYADYVTKPIGETNQIYLSGDVDVTLTNRTIRFQERRSKINLIRARNTVHNRTPIPTKDLYEEYLGIYERKNRKIELIKRSRTREKTKSENVGYVYVLSNESLPPNTYKIGSTYGLPEERAEELTGTGHLTPFKVVAKTKIQSAEYYEKSIHKILRDYRVKQGREFFKLDLKKIKDCFKQVSELSDKGEKKLTLSDLKKRIKI